MTPLVYLILVTLANSHSSIQDAPTPLLIVRQWNLQQVSLRQQHCGTSVLLQHYSQPLSPPALISARSRRDKNGHIITKRQNAQQRVLHSVRAFYKQAQQLRCMGGKVLKSGIWCSAQFIFYCILITSVYPLGRSIEHRDCRVDFSSTPCILNGFISAEWHYCLRSLPKPPLHGFKSALSDAQILQSVSCTHNITFRQAVL